MLETVTVVGVVVLAILIWFFVRTRSKDLITELMEKAALQLPHRVAS